MKTYFHSFAGVALAVTLSTAFTLCAADDIGHLQQSFEQPPNDARIMVRWWWFGPSVTNVELERELRVMKQGGIGGVEIQPVYPLALDDAASGIKNLPYLSDGFLDALRFTSQKAAELGMRLDLTLGSGWPYGGPQVPVSQAAAMLRIVRVSLSGGASRVPVPAIAEGERLIAVFAGPAQGAQSLESFRQVTSIQNGVVAVPADLGSGNELLFFIASRTGQQVKRAAVGAEGFVVDHYDNAAVEQYLHNVGDRLMQAFDQRPPYAVFCDSLEVYGADWTGDFLAEFQKRRGYDLKPYLPALAVDLGPESQEIRSDWGRTLTELFNERFAVQLHRWAEQRHTKLRMQAYGMPPAELSTSGLVDLPEGEGAEWRTLSATRWASSASHIYGVPVTSSETWTWLHSPVFRATPLDMKAEADLHFLEGINQLIGHGWPYTPPGAAYPGWRFYAAAVFDEKNPWWIAMPDITRYLQRMSFLLRQGSPVNDVAMYLSTSDALAHLRPGRVNLFTTIRDELGPALVPEILQAGFNVDFFDDDALRKTGRVDGASLALGSNRYRLVILPGVERIPADTYRALQRFADSGGIVIATRRAPDRAPGFHASAADSTEVRTISQKMFAGAGAARMIADESKLGAALAQALQPDLALSQPSGDIGFVHRRAGDADIYFVANTSNTRQSVSATFRVSGTGLEIWNAMDGTAATARIASSSTRGSTVSLDLAPYESRVLVFHGHAAPVPNRAAAASQPIDLSSGWQVKFADSGVTQAMDQLRSWTDDERTRYFSGVATYERSFTLPQSALRAGAPLLLDFGEGTPIPPQRLKSGTRAWLDPPVREAAVIFVNGQRAGSLWCPPYRLDVTRWLRAGQNDIRIEVANLALNYMAGHALPDYRLLNLRYGVRFEAQDMDKVQPVPAGLLGPIRLVSEPH